MIKCKDLARKKEEKEDKKKFKVHENKNRVSTIQYLVVGKCDGNRRHRENRNKGSIKKLTI
jgi:hypothetical protein